MRKRASTETGVNNIRRTDDRPVLRQTGFKWVVRDDRGSSTPSVPAAAKMHFPPAHLKKIDDRPA